MPRGIPGSGNSKYGLTIAANVQGANKIKALGNSMQGVQGKAKNLAGAFKGLLGPLVALGGAAVAVQTLRKSFDVLAEREADFATLSNGLARVSTDAPKAAKALRAMADELGYKTLFDEKAFQKGFALLTSFKNIGLDSYGRVAETAADLAQINQVDLKSSFLQLAKALSDPTRGLTALSRSGVIFTEQQREMILELHNSGEEMKAQAEILRIVEGSYKGAARAAATGLAGAFDTLGQKVRDFNEALGKAAAPLLEPLVKATTEVFGVITDGLNALSDDIIPFANNIKTALTPLFKWIIENLKNIFTWFDQVFATQRNLRALQIKQGDGEFNKMRKRLLKEAEDRAIAQFKEENKLKVGDTFRYGGFKKTIKEGDPLIGQNVFNPADFAGVIKDKKWQEFNKLVEEEAIKQLGLFKTVTPEISEMNAALKDNMTTLEGLKLTTKDTGEVLNQTFGEHIKIKLDKFKDSIKTVQEAMADVVVSGIKKMEDSLVEFVTTGKLKFRDLANSIIKDMIRIAIQQAITKPFTNFIGNIFNPLSGARANGGNVVGGSSYLVGERGAEIFTPSSSGHITPNNKIGGNTSVVVNVNASGNSNVQGDAGQAEKLGQAISQAIKEELVEQRRPGGLLYT